MSGKSTLMRALAVAALLANCGLHVPCTGGASSSSSSSKGKKKKEGGLKGQGQEVSRVPRFDNIFVRTASFDVPAEVSVCKEGRMGVCVSAITIITRGGARGCEKNKVIVVTWRRVQPP